MNIANFAQRLSEQVPWNKKLTFVGLLATKHNDTAEIILYKNFSPDISIRFYITVNPSALDQAVYSLLNSLSDFAFRNKKGAMLKFQHYYRLDTIVVYAGEYFLDFVKKMSDGLFFDTIVPFTRRIAKGRGIAMNVRITKDLERELNIPESEQSNANVY